VSWRAAVYRVVVRRGRGGPAEAEHRVTAMACVPGAEESGFGLVAGDAGRDAGDGAPDAPENDFVTFFRSGCKPFQALPLVERGHAERFGFGARELAVMAASHSGSRAHVETVRGILERIGLDERALLCGFHFPQDPESDAALRSGRVEPSPVYNNCSGKHAGMLALAVAEGWPTAAYTSPEHPVQRACVAAVAETCGLSAHLLPVGIDGCSAANPALPLSAMARGFARLARARAAGATARERALARLRAAMLEHPALVAGEGRFDTDLMRAADGGVVSKGGAEGLQCVGVPGAGAGIAVKVHDGAHRAVGPATVAFLVAEGWLGEEAALALAHWAEPVVHNHRGLEVGEVRVIAGPKLSSASTRAGA
jgi:L-asparaginase II